MHTYTMAKQQLIDSCRFPVTIVDDHATLVRQVTKKITNLIKDNNDADRSTSLILPVGPLAYEPLAEACNSMRLPLDRLTIFMMDEYLQSDGKAISESHPLSFKGFMQKSLVDNLDPSLGFSMERVVFPLPENVNEVSERILSMGGVDLCCGGVGINGHFAFNDPPRSCEQGKDLNWLRSCTARVVTPTPETVTQMAMGGTFGNWELIPPMAATLGLKELLASKKICLTFMRNWHSGVLRRTLYGPVTVDWPASLIQEHKNVEVLITELAASEPLTNITQSTGEE
jgi:glucosamine-6-phosphate deaminase